MQKELLCNVHHFCPELTELPWGRLATKTFWVPNMCQEPDSITSSWSPFCYCSVAKSCLTLCNPMNCSTPGFPVLHCLLEFSQIHVHWLWCYLTISSSAAFISFCLQSFPASRSLKGGSSNGKMATHSSILACRIPWMEEPSGLQFTGVAKSQTWQWLHCHFHFQMVKNLPAMQETLVQFLGWEDPLEKG